MQHVIMMGPSSAAKGGIATVIGNFEKSFHSPTIKIHTIATWKEGRFTTHMWFFGSAILQLIYYLIKYPKGIVHLHTSQKGSFFRKRLLLKIAKCFRVKVLLHLHGSRFEIAYNQQSASQQQKIRNDLSQFDRLVVLSNEWAEYFHTLCSTPITVMENAVELPKENLYTTNRKKIVILGNISLEKGSFDLLQAIHMLKDAEADYLFVFYGIGDTEGATKYIKEQNLTNVQLGGWIDGEQKEAVFREAILHILPSYHEGLPMAILETMAHGIPNISTNVGGIPQIINHESNGFLVEAGEVAALAQAIKKSLSHPDVLNKMSQQAYQTIKEKFSLTAYNHRWSEIYQQMSEQ